MMNYVNLFRKDIQPSKGLTEPKLTVLTMNLSVAVGLWFQTMEAQSDVILSHTTNKCDHYWIKTAYTSSKASGINFMINRSRMLSLIIICFEYEGVAWVENLLLLCTCKFCKDVLYRVKIACRYTPCVYTTLCRIAWKLLIRISKQLATADVQKIMRGPKNVLGTPKKWRAIQTMVVDKSSEGVPNDKKGVENFHQQGGAQGQRYVTKDNMGHGKIWGWCVISVKWHGTGEK